MKNNADAPLSKNVKKSLAIVLIGNFLEFFDIMLAVHLTVVLSKVFIPADSPYKVTLTILTFCSSFCIRPIAAIFWGYIGDTIGRVPVLISTTFLMSISCLLIPNIPSYAEWGIASTILFFLMRFVQGFASGGECIAADVFITETVPKPKVYFCSAMVEATCSLGGLMACGIGALCIFLSPENGWKLPFYIGSGIAVIGTIARKTLKETPEFISAIEKKFGKKRPTGLFSQIKFKNRNIASLFALYFFPTMAFYFSYAYLPSVLGDKLGLSPNVVMLQTTLVLIIVMCAEVSYGLLGLKFHPFKILKFKLIGLLCIAPLLMIGFSGLDNQLNIFIIQVIVSVLGQGLTPAAPIFNKSFPVFGRYTHLLLIWASSTAFMYMLTGYVCENISSFNGLCVLLFVSASISLVGLYTFVPHDNYQLKDDSIGVSNKENTKQFDKWIKTVESK